MTDSIVSAKEVRFTYPGGIRAINGVSLEIQRGERVAILVRTVLENQLLSS